MSSGSASLLVAGFEDVTASVLGIDSPSAARTCRGDLARVVDCAASPSIPVHKSPKQTMQVSDIRRLYFETFSFLKAKLKASGEDIVLANVMVDVEGKEGKFGVELEIIGPAGQA